VSRKRQLDVSSDEMRAHYAQTLEAARNHLRLGHDYGEDHPNPFWGTKFSAAWLKDIVAIAAWAEARVLWAKEVKTLCDLCNHDEVTP
jgi:hypothetical protein